MATHILIYYLHATLNPIGAHKKNALEEPKCCFCARILFLARDGRPSMEQRGWRAVECERTSLRLLIDAWKIDVFVLEVIPETLVFGGSIQKFRRRKWIPALRYISQSLPKLRMWKWIAMTRNWHLYVTIYMRFFIALHKSTKTPKAALRTFFCINRPTNPAVWCAVWCRTCLITSRIQFNIRFQFAFCLR